MNEQNDRTYFQISLVFKMSSFHYMRLCPLTMKENETRFWKLTQREGIAVDWRHMYNMKLDIFSQPLHLKLP